MKIKYRLEKDIRDILTLRDCYSSISKLDSDNG